MDLSLDPIIARLDAQVAALKKVGGAADFEAALAELKIEPAAFVIPLRDAAQPNTLENAVSQRVISRFGVALAVQNLRDASGTKAQTELAPLRDSVITALLGWAPDADRDPCEYGGGRLLRLRDRVLWWLDEFVTAYYVRKT